MTTVTGSQGTRGPFETKMRPLYRGRPGRPELIEVPGIDALVVEGRSLPSDPAFREAVQALYAIAYGIKFRSRASAEPTIPVLPLETLWWLDHDASFGAPTRPARWQALIPVPEEVTVDRVAAAAAEARGRHAIPALDLVRLEQRPAERAAQILHFGPYAEERPTVQRLLAFIIDQRLAVGGPHHEIYLSDPNRTRPERLRTLIRYAVVPG